MELRESETFQNLARAFAGECQDGARYQFIRQKATQDQYPAIGNQLKLLATNEMAHAKELYQLITDGCTDCIENITWEAGYPFKAGSLIEEIKTSAENEKLEGEKIYPEFAKVAKKEGFAEISKKFLQIAEVEKKHHQILDQLYQKMKKNKLYKATNAVMWVCSNCGHTETSKSAWEHCPLCHAPKGAVQIPQEQQN